MTVTTADFISEPSPGYGKPGSLLWHLNRAKDYLDPDEMARVSTEVVESRARTAYDFILGALEQVRG